MNMNMNKYLNKLLLKIVGVAVLASVAVVFENHKLCGALREHA